MLRAIFALVALCLGLSFAAAQPPAPAPAVTMDDIKKAWQERQDKVKTLKMSWKRTVVKAKGSMDLMATAFKEKAVSLPQPPRDLRLQGEAKIELDSDNYRFDSRTETWWVPTQTARMFQRIAIYDGKEAKQSEGFIDERQTAALKPASEASLSLELLELYPIWWCTRGVKDPLGKDTLSEYELTGRSFRHRDTSCVELESKARSSNKVRRLLLTSEKYLPMQYDVTVRGKLVTHMEMEYGGLKQNGIIPTKWRYAMHLPVGGLHESLDMESTTCEIGGATSSEAFRLVSDPGTVVVNTQGEFEKVAVTLPDGTTSDFVDRRNVRSYDELVAATKPLTPWYWWGIGLGLVAAVGYGLSRLCYRRRSA